MKIIDKTLPLLVWLLFEFVPTRGFVASPSRTACSSHIFSMPDQSGSSVDPWGGYDEGGTADGQEDGRLSDEELEATLEDWDDKIARFNTVHLVGRIGNDPEPRYFDDGKVVVNLSLACKRKYHNLERKALNIKSGDEETDWYGLEIWGQTAEFVSKYVDKGARVGVIGSLQVDQWLDKESGEKREKAKVIVRDFDILETRAEAELRRGGGRGSGGGGENRGGGGENRRGPSFYTKDDDDDDYNPASGGAGGFFD
jgi:single-strand DNA-binding protein